MVSHLDGEREFGELRALLCQKMQTPFMQEGLRNEPEASLISENPITESVYIMSCLTALP